MLNSILNGKWTIDTLYILVARIAVLALCFPIHECAHAWMANKLGDPTGKKQGRISLNPAKHLDWFGAITVVLLGFGYAKPVPVDIRNFKKPKLYFALTALAGPVSNLLMAVVLMVFNRIFWGIGNITATQSIIWDFGILLTGYAALVNINLAVFNLIPVPPLDGSRLIMAVLPNKVYIKFLKAERYLVWILFAAIILCNRIGISPIGTISIFIYECIFRVLYFGV